MDVPTLNVAAPVFTPGAGARSNAPPVAREPSPMRSSSSASGQDTPVRDQRPSLHSNMLSQIQNQMTPGGGVPGGMVHMNAASRPFVPGGAAPLYKQEVPVTPHHSAPPPTNGFSRSPLAGHALAHGLNPGSVQLTGLPAFLATPPIMTNPPYNSAYPAGPPSPISPGASVPPSPFAMSHPPNALGLPRQGPPMGANMNARRGRGPQPVTPLKSSGHNSTPSISMNPAAFAANLAALKAKKKVVVSIPNEKPLPDDSALISQHDCQSLNSSPDFNRDDQEPSSSTEAVKLRHALAAAQTRNKWILRQPWTRDLHDQVPCLDVPQDAIITCAVHPEPWPHSLGLPDTIEIYLPGQSAWDEYQEQRYEEQQLEAEAAALEQQQLQLNVVPLLQPKPLLPSELAIFAPDHKIRSFSISTPADPNMVSFKLNRFLQSQHADSAAANDASGAQALKDEPGPFARLNSDLPSRLREAFARRRGESTDISLRPPTSKHGHTMSLGLPSSGGPFGPEVFSALDLIRANSDQGPSQPPSDTHDAEMPLSDSEVMAPRAPFLAEIAEDDAEEEDANAANAGASSKPSGSGNWKDLGRGFGYEVEPNAQASTSNGKARSHARQTSRISVSTSRRGGQDSDELLSDGEDLEIRTNPSEDADASDFEEDVGEYGEEHWHARRASAHLSAFGDAHGRHGFGSVSGASDDDSLRDSLTPSDEQFSNPSDEEAAREERMLRRQHRAAERAARQERKARLRARANTDNTLPSSSIGEADLYENGRYDSDGDHADAQRHDRARRRDLDDIVSNPSDEVHSDFNGTETFGHTHRHGRNDDSPRLSQDFRFPPPKPTRPNASQPRSSNGPTMSGTLGRAAGSSMLNPGAKEFTFGGVASASAGTRAVSAPVSNGQDAGAHFRLPSIKTSSFGSSALGEAASHAPHLNVGAPSFTPGAFTFKAPDGVRLELPSATRSAATGTDAGAEDDRTAQRERQGREKRTRYGPIDYASEDEHDAAYSTSPPRPKASAASIEGPLRSFSTLSRQGPPPFLPPNFQQQQQQQQQQRAVSHDSRFTAEAPSFVPTWAKGAAAFGGSASFKRPTLPDWAPAEKKPTPSIRDPSMFTMETGSKAIPILRPAEDEAEQSATQNRSPQSGIAAQRNATMQATSPAQSSMPKFDGPGAAGEASGKLSNNTLSAPAPWESSRKSESGWQAERARPIHIPTGPHSFQSSMAGSLVSNAEARLGMRWAPHHTPSLSRDSMSVSSAGRRQRRSDRSPQKHRAVKYDDGDDEDDDESLTDFVEEIAERIDKALEGWAGKILDEVTIMGQVRPNPRHLSPAAVEVSLDQDKIVQELSRRVEEAFDTHLANTFQSHSRKMTDASDETQTTIRPPRQRNSSSDDKVASGLADASGEWDFDYVQEILDMKLGELRDQFKTSITQVIERIDGRSESLDRGVAQEADHVNGLTVADVQTKLAESVAARVLEPLDSLLRSHVQTALESRSASEGKLEQSVQAKLDENLFLLSEKGAADRSSLQHMLEARVQDLEGALGEIVGSVKLHFENAFQERLPAIAEDVAARDLALADRLANQLGQALGPVLSENRRCLLEDNQRSRDVVLESIPSASQTAQATLQLLEPLVHSLKSDPIDSDALVTRIAEVIGKQSIEHMVDLNPVLALLEPLITKQDDARAFSKKILQRQEETDQTLSELPAAINAKTEIFLSSASATSETQAQILQEIGAIKAEIERKASESTDAVPSSVLALQEKLEELTRDRELHRETAGKTLAELASVYHVLNSSYEALSRLEAQHATTEETHRELLVQFEKQAQEQWKLGREVREAEARAARAEASKAELASRSSASDEEAVALREQVSRLTAELAAVKAEKAQEKEGWTKALAAETARAERAEATSAEMQGRLSRVAEQAGAAEREAYESAKAVLERASKAEGQIVALEKRLAEQDTKIANLQQVCATQKQKAAQSHQKLAEGEKRVKELEAKADELTEATARLGVLEGAAAELGGVKQQLHKTEQREAHVRAELEQYDARFGELERELVEMKANFVEAATHETTQSELATSQALVDTLRAQVAALEAAAAASPAGTDGWEAVETPRTGAWASMHAPRAPARVSRKNLGVLSAATSADTSAEWVEAPARSCSFASTAGSRKQVEVDEGGWWS